MPVILKFPDRHLQLSRCWFWCSIIKKVKGIGKGRGGELCRLQASAAPTYLYVIRGEFWKIKTHFSSGKGLFNSYHYHRQAHEGDQAHFIHVESESWRLSEASQMITCHLSSRILFILLLELWSAAKRLQASQDPLKIHPLLTPAALVMCCKRH